MAKKSNPTIRIRLTPQAYDVLLITAFCELRAIRGLLGNLYAKSLGLDNQQALGEINKIADNAYDEALAYLAKFSDLDVPEMRQALGLNDPEN